MQYSYVKVKVRKALKERANGKCERCGNERLLELHHLTSWRSGGSNEIGNLELICQECHTNLKKDTWQSKGKFKTLNVLFTDEEFAPLQKRKIASGLIWHDFILQLTKHVIIQGGFHDVDEFYPE